MRAGAPGCDTVARIASASEGRLLTAAEEQELGRIVQAGITWGQDATTPALTPLALEARNLLVERNLALVWRYAYGFRGRGLELEDLYGHGVGGLIHAANKFDPGRGLKFSTSAVNWVKQRMGRAIQDESHVIRLPVHMQERISDIAGARTELTNRLRRQPTDAEIAERLGLDGRQLQAAYKARALSHTRSLDAPAPTHKSGTGRTGHELIADPAGEDPALIALDADPALLAEANESGEIVRRLLAALPPKLRRVMLLRHGLDGHGEPRTLEECGQVLGVTRERVRQLERDALRYLRDEAARLQLSPAAGTPTLATAAD